jgi:predicted DNA-binding protein
MKSSQINIRFTPQIEADLNAICEKLGINKSALVRKLTEVFIAEVKRTGSLTLDHRWLRELGQADGRSEWGERKLKAEDKSSGPNHNHKDQTP